MRYFLELRYDGAAYCGWQRQPDAPTVQQTIEQALSKLLRHSVEIVGAGRTDTGVNASYYVAHFDTDAEFDTKQLLYKVNLVLPHDISIESITSVPGEAHARFDAREREYTYYISTVKNPFRRHSAWINYQPLDVDKMNEAAKSLLEYSDFTSFAKLNSNNKTNICRIMVAEWVREEGGVLRFTIRADRFLRNMVRSIVGTLVDVGRGRYTVEEFRAIVEAKDLSRSSAGAPAQGLFLSDVVYPKEIFTK
jgi:tRNA pseudouridine38-40 synthase